MSTIEWKCPECKATPDAHGKGGKGRCLNNTRECEGFVCECYDEPNVAATHGESHDDPCPTANCYHCGWSGKFPQPPKAAQAWEKKALAAGWTPPAGWKGGAK